MEDRGGGGGGRGRGWRDERRKEQGPRVGVGGCGVFVGIGRADRSVIGWRIDRGNFDKRPSLSENPRNKSSSPGALHPGSTGGAPGGKSPRVAGSIPISS